MIVKWGWQFSDLLLLSRFATGPLAVNHALGLWSTGLPRLFYLNPLTGLGEDNGTPFFPPPGEHYPWGVAVLPDRPVLP
jgi:hypothetical protein